MTNAERDLLDFLKAWREWTRDTSISSPFRPCYGLCTNSDLYAEEVELETVPAYEMYDRWKAEGLGTAYPFGEDEYDERSDAETQHECPVRLAWVDKTILELEAKA